MGEHSGGGPPAKASGPGRRNPGRLKTWAWRYGAVCLVVGAASLGLESWAKSAAVYPGRMLLCLVPGGTALFAALARWRPSVEHSEFFRVFAGLYHPGIWTLALSAAIGHGEWGAGQIGWFVHLAEVAGWTLVAAAMIILILMVREKRD